MRVEIAEKASVTEPIEDRNDAAEGLLGAGGGFPGPKHLVPAASQASTSYSRSSTVLSVHACSPVITIGPALVYAGGPALWPQGPILVEGGGHGKLLPSVDDTAAIPGPAMALEERTIGHAASRLEVDTYETFPALSRGRPPACLRKTSQQRL
jgi:hypothetical protein